MFCRSLTTAELVLSLHGRANTKPVAASTAVQIATWPSLDRGMLSKSMWSLSPNSRAMGCIVSRGSLLYLWGGLVLAQRSQDLQKFSVSVVMPFQYQFSCRRLSVYGAEVCPHSSCTRYNKSGCKALGTKMTRLAELLWYTVLQTSPWNKWVSLARLGISESGKSCLWASMILWILVSLFCWASNMSRSSKGVDFCEKEISGLLLIAQVDGGELGILERASTNILLPLRNSILNGINCMISSDSVS